MKQNIYINSQGVPVYSKEELQAAQEERIKREQERIRIQQEEERKRKIERNSKWYLGIAIFCFIEAVAGPFIVKNESFSTIFGGVLTFLILAVVFGLLYFNCKRKLEEGTKKNIIVVTPEVSEAAVSQIQLIIQKIQLFKSESFIQNTPVIEELNRLISNLKSIELLNLEVPEYVYQSLNEVLDKLLHTSKIPDFIKQETMLDSLEDGFKSINVALEKFISDSYDNNFSSIEIDLEALKTKLGMDGYLK